MPSIVSPTAAIVTVPWGASVVGGAGAGGVDVRRWVPAAPE